MSEEIKKSGGNGDKLQEENKPEVNQEQKELPKDYKIAEIWIKNDTVALDAVPGFWMDRLRARGIIAYLDDIVKDYNPADRKKKSLIERMNMQNLRDVVRGGFRNKRK